MVSARLRASTMQLRSRTSCCAQQRLQHASLYCRLSLCYTHFHLHYFAPAPERPRVPAAHPTTPRASCAAHPTCATYHLPLTAVLAAYLDSTHCHDIGLGTGHTAARDHMHARQRPKTCARMAFYLATYTMALDVATCLVHFLRKTSVPPTLPAHALHTFRAWPLAYNEPPAVALARAKNSTKLLCMFYRLRTYHRYPPPNTAVPYGLE